AKEPVMLSPDFIGLGMEPGNHRINFEYRVPAYKSFLIVFGIASLIALFLFEKSLNRVTELFSGIDKFAQGLSVHFPEIKTRLAPAAIIFIAAVIAALPLFQGKFVSGHDALEYPPRVAVFYKGLSEGSVFPRWSQDFGAGYGEPFFSFNPPIIYYLPSLFY